MACLPTLSSLCLVLLSRVILDLILRTKTTAKGYTQINDKSILNEVLGVVYLFIGVTWTQVPPPQNMRFPRFYK
jgi:hypothetical protein